MKIPNIKDTLFCYVTNTNNWFYWYHNLERLKRLHDDDHNKGKDYNPDKYCGFIKRPWRFTGKTVTNNENKCVVIEGSLADFFEAVLDEVRLKKANDFAEYALYISDNEDLAYFRNTVTKREVIADIDYNRQRDHAVHTLYNYLLGWYIFEYSSKLREEFQRHFGVDRDGEINTKAEEVLLSSYTVEFENFKKGNNELNLNCDLKHIALVHEFADLWPIASLLHDIGYILEGSLSSASPDVEHLRVKNGSKIIHDYFNHYFWKSFEVDFRVGKNIAKILNVVVPDFKYSESLASLGDRLCDIGSCENIRKSFNENNTKDELIKNKIITGQYGLNLEVFSIWKEHYRFHKNKQMENILCVVERVYKNMMWVGADYGKRSLDHGVCSGLITLLALTFFRELFWGFRQIEWAYLPEAQKDEESFCDKQDRLGNTCDLISHELFVQIKKEIIRVPKRIRVIRGECDNEYCELRPDFWFNKILWATAASAIHSIIQKPEYKKQCQKHFNTNRQATLDRKLEKLKISFKDDPLAFLGVFVDVLQEWDRYTVTGRGEAAFSGVAPLQSAEVYLYPNKKTLDESWLGTSYIKNKNQHNEDAIYLTYPVGNEKKDWIKELNKTMGYGLKDDWNDIVEIVAYNPD